jgi:hypothetical protein
MREQGTALVLSLLVIVCLSGLGLGLVAASSAERQIAGNARGAAAVGLAADAVVEAAMSEAAGFADWSALLAGTTSRFHDTTHRPLTPSRATIDLDRITADLQLAAAASYPIGVNTPVWQLFAWGPLTALAGLAAGDSGAYVAVWVADDPADTDGLPMADANGTVMLHGEAFGYGATRRSTDAVIARAPAGVRVLSWRNG